MRAIVSASKLSRKALSDRSTTSIKPPKLSTMKRVGFLMCAVMLAACGPSTETVNVLGTPASQATDGKVVLEPQPDFGNAHISLELTHVTPPERLSAPAHFFIVWQKIGSNSYQIGQLDYDAEKREARFEGSVLSGPFELIVTAESSARPQQPSAQMLLVKTMHGEGG